MSSYYNPSAAAKKPDEGLIQSGGYTHLIQIGSAADLPTLSASPLWRKASQIQETVGTVTDYLFGGDRAGAGSRTHHDDEAAVTDTKEPTTWAYLGVQQILAGRIPDNIAMVRNLLSSLGKPLDDRKLQLEQVVGWLATTGISRGDGPNKTVNGVQGQFINLLWNDLPHPPTVDLNPKHRFRTPDGRDNNLSGYPLLGAANQAYSRSVKPVHPVAPYVAEPEDMFDAILRRPTGYDGFVPHPAGISSLMLAFANVIIHDIFWTNNGSEVPTSDTYPPSKPAADASKSSDSSKRAQWQTLTSSYLSLDPLYGVNEMEQNTVRDREGDQLGRGLLYNDTFASSRLLLMPPASCVLLVLFSRNHNRIARKLLEINERGTWSNDLASLTREQRQQQDDEIFGTARHVNCGYFVGAILHDYLQAILNTIQVDSDWCLDPRASIKNILGSTPKGAGNSVSVEFNTLYRWHAPISWSQTKWIEGRMSKGLPSQNWDTMSASAMGKSIDILKKQLNAQSGSPPKTWKISKYEVRIPGQGPPEVVSEGVYERDPETGKFRDEDLARVLKDSTHEIAGAFGARHTPAVLRWVECEGMRTARDVWKTCTLNEFRSFLGLKEFETFQEWNSDASIASAMEDLVGHPSNIPLHVGLHGEEAKKPSVGAGLCPNYTISRAILSDAVALVRGDRFYTDHATADTMTDWGLNDCRSDPQNGAYGGMIEKLIRNNLPNQYVFNDCALLFPFMVPEHTYSILYKISASKALNYSLLPAPLSKMGYHRVRNGEKTFVYEISDTSQVEKERMSLIFGLSHMNSKIEMVYKAVEHVMSEQDANQYRKYVHSRIEQCSKRRSPVSDEETVDIARDITNPLITGCLAHVFGLVETGLHSQQHLLCALSDIYLYLADPTQISFKSRNSARIAASGLAWQIRFHIQASTSTGSLSGLIRKGASILTAGALDVLEDSIKTITGQSSIKNVHADCRAFYRALDVSNNAQDSPLSLEELTADCLRAASTLAFTIVNGTAHAIDHLMPSPTSRPDEHPQLRDSLRDVVSNRSFERPDAQEAYLKHALEAARVTHWDVILRGLIVKPEHEARKYRRPLGVIENEFRLDRNVSEYLRLLDVEGYCLPIFASILPIVIHEVFSLPKVRRANGRQGRLEKIMITGEVPSIPTMHIKYDGAMFRSMPQTKPVTRS